MKLDPAKTAVLTLDLQKGVLAMGANYESAMAKPCDGTRAFDLDFKLTVIEDACFDSDSELHRNLMEKVYAKRGSVLKAAAFIAEQI